MPVAIYQYEQIAGGVHCWTVIHAVYVTNFWVELEMAKLS
jgi:hypothetical protein